MLQINHVAYILDMKCCIFLEDPKQRNENSRLPSLY